MKIDIKSINDLYFERYIGTKKMIDRFHEMVHNEEYIDDPEKINRIGLIILHDFIAHYKEREGVKSHSDESIS